MGKTLVATPIYSDAATVTANSEDADFPVSNLLTMQVRGGDRFKTDGVLRAQIRFDFGTQKPANLAWLGFVNATADATLRFRMAQSEAELDSAAVVDDAGGFGCGLRFDGQNRATVSDAGLIGLSSFTIDLMAWPDLIARGGMFTLSGSGGTAVVLSLSPSGLVRFYALPGIVGDLQSSLPIALGSYTRIAGTFDSASQTMRLFVGASEVDSATGVGASLVTTPASEEIAGLDAAGGYRFRGRIDDVRIWDHARTGAQLLADDATELAGTEPGLVTYHKLNEGVGTSAASSVAGRAAAVLSGSPVPLWSFPERFWASPGLDDPDLEGLTGLFTHGLYYNAIGAQARWAEIDILDPRNPAGHISAGRAYVSNAWVSERGRLYGDSLGGVNGYSRRTRLNGATTVRRILARERQRFDVISTSEAEVLRRYSTISKLREGRDVLICHDIDDESTRHWKMIYGLMDEAREPQNRAPGVWALPLAVEGL